MPRSRVSARSAAQERDGRLEHAGLALDRLQHDRDGPRRDGRLDRGKVVQRHLHEAGHLGFVEMLPLRLARRRHRGKRAAVEAVIHGDDLIGAVAMFRAPFARQLDGALVGLGAAVGEEHLMQPAMPRQQIGQPDHLIVVEGGAAVDQSLGLARQRLEDRPRRMAEAVHRPALDEIEIAAAFAVGKPRTLGRATKTIGGRGVISMTESKLAVLVIMSSWLLVGWSDRDPVTHEGPRRCRRGPS